MQMNSLKDLYVHELRDLYNAERQIVNALPKLKEAASSNELKQAFDEHLEQTRGQIKRLDQVFEKLNTKPTGEKCVAMEGIIEEGENFIKENQGEPEVIDAGLIAAAQKVEHYEIAGYGTVTHYANMLGDEESAKILAETLEEEKSTDNKLNDLAKNMVNPQAAK